MALWVPSGFTHFVVFSIQFSPKNPKKTSNRKNSFSLTSSEACSVTGLNTNTSQSFVKTLQPGLDGSCDHCVNGHERTFLFHSFYTNSDKQ